MIGKRDGVSVLLLICFSAIVLMGCGKNEKLDTSGFKHSSVELYGGEDVTLSFVEGSFDKETMFAEVEYYNGKQLSFQYFAEYQLEVLVDGEWLVATDTGKPIAMHAVILTLNYGNRIKQKVDLGEYLVKPYSGHYRIVKTLRPIKDSDMGEIKIAAEFDIE
ncbi:MAG: hypothetical protein IKO30_01230 [Lachnospiraceae bacterium]|nr:hypothetical protein [Lachnospiraceae bacterium]